jgi:hypothetical protein
MPSAAARGELSATKNKPDRFYVNENPKLQLNRERIRGARRLFISAMPFVTLTARAGWPHVARRWSMPEASGATLRRLIRMQPPWRCGRARFWGGPYGAMLLLRRSQQKHVLRTDSFLAPGRTMHASGGAPTPPEAWHLRLPRKAGAPADRRAGHSRGAEGGSIRPAVEQRL